MKSIYEKFFPRTSCVTYLSSEQRGCNFAGDAAPRMCQKPRSRHTTSLHGDANSFLERYLSMREVKVNFTHLFDP